MTPTASRGIEFPGIATAFRKYSRIFRVSLIERLHYRGDFFFSTILRFLPMLTTILLWRAIFFGAKETTGETELAGYRYQEMVAYLLLVHISRMFSSMPGLAGGIARDIRDGTLKKYLLQPLDMLGYLLAYRMAHKAAYIATSFLPYAALFAACWSYFDRLPDGPTFAGYIVSLVLSFVIGFYFEACVGMVGFWLLDVSSLLYIIMTLNYFISGHMFPLDLLPPNIASVLKALPTQYLAYFPAAVFLGRYTGAELVWGLVIQAAWALGLMLIARLLYRFGLRRYSAYGG
jgi:ABC-2 type transport system permease protein